MPSILLRREWLLSCWPSGSRSSPRQIVYLSRPTTLTVAVGPRDGAEAILLDAYAQALVARSRRRPAQGRSFRRRPRQRRGAAGEPGRPRGGPSRRAPARQRPDPGHPARRGPAHRRAGGRRASRACPISRASVSASSSATAPTCPSSPTCSASTTSRRGGRAGTGRAPLEAGHVALVPLKPAEVTKALDEDRVDAVAVIAAPASKAAISTVRAVEAASPEKKIDFVSVPDGEAIVQRMPELQATTIPAGTFGGRPKRPDEDVKTVGASLPPDGAGRRQPLRRSPR